MTLPAFVVIGAQKAGTTSLFHYLADHPQIYLHPIKEINYFAWPDAKRNLRRYIRFFAKAPHGAVCGDVSTDYAKCPAIQDVPRRMSAVVPDARLLYIVRHPVRRAVSHYHHEILQGVRRLAPIDEELRTRAEFVDFGRYFLQIERYLQYFDPRQIQVVVFEELLADKVGTMKRVFGHIGCDTDYTPSNLDVCANASETSVQFTKMVHVLSNIPGYQAVRFMIPGGVRQFAVRALSRRRPELPWPSPETIQWLAERFERDVESLTSYLGRSTPPWELLKWRRTSPQASESGEPVRATAASAISRREAA